MDLRLRITSIIVIFSSAIFLLATILTILNARSAVVDEVSSTLKLAQQLNLSNKKFITIQQLGNIRHLRIVPDNKSYNVNEFSKEEFTIQGVPQAFVQFVLPKKQSLILQLPSPSGNGFFLVANPTDEIEESWQETRTFLGLLLFLTITTSIAVYIVVGHALKPVNIILEGLREIKSGNFHKRLPDFNLPEYSAISRDFNTMVKNLEQSQQQNLVLTEKMLNVQELERKSLARDLHDEMGQSLTAMKAFCASAKYHKIPKAVDNHLSSINSTCDNLFKVVRNMMQHLTPPLLEEFGLTVAIEELVNKWKLQNECDVILQIDPDLQNIKSKNDIHLFRIIQESLTNVLKHSAANRVVISLITHKLDNGKSSIILTIEDNGKGFDLKQTEGGTGLNGIRERALILDAKLKIHSQLGNGTTMTLELPNKDNNDETD
ncbi:MAG: sensor histidine kinase [Cocleimonas sp.]|nr:sensor histidine kinase [Cocleimonas sp.]